MSTAYGSIRQGFRWVSVSKVEIDWMREANCVVDDPEDRSFLYRPDEVTRKRWQRICLTCDVFDKCLKWSDTAVDGLKPSGVYAAGEWRE